MENEVDVKKFKADGRGGSQRTRIKLIIEAIISLPKTLYFNLRIFPFRLALKTPMLVSHKIKIIELKRKSISFDCNPKRFMVKIGFGGSDGIVPRKGEICLENGNVVFQGKATFAEGFSLRNSGIIKFGDNFFSNRNCTIWCSKKISFGNDVLMGWNITFRDSDGHLVIENNIPKTVEKSISIGDHCWICSESHVLKGAKLGNDCILGYGSLLVSDIEGNNLLVVGHPAKKIKDNINWFRGD